MSGLGTLQYFVGKTGEHRMIDFHNHGGSKVAPDMWVAESRGRTEISGYTLLDDWGHWRGGADPRSGGGIALAT